MNIKFTNNPFFIFGCGRSGTSLLSRMLNQHSKLAVPYESHLFNTFLPLLKYYGDLNDKSNRARLIGDILLTDVMNDWEPKIYKNEIEINIISNSFGGIVDAIMNTWAKKNGKTRWGEKTPHHIDYWDEITKYWPKAKVIHIYRDGRDVALSLLNARFGPKTIYANSKYWSNYLNKVEKLKTKLNDSFLHELSYEKLLQDPEKELKDICNFLGEDYEINMMEFYKNKSEYRTDKQNLKNLQQPIIKNNSGKWKNQMSEKDVRIFEAISGDFLVQYGYMRESEDPKISNFEHIFYGKILSLGKKIFSMLKNQKGHKDSFIKLKIKTKLLLGI